MKTNLDDAALAFGDVAVSAARADRSFAGVQKRALENVRRDFKELFSVLPEEERWAGAVASWILLNATCEPKNILEDSFVCQGWLETALFSLITAGTLSLAVSTPEAERDLIRLGKSVRFHNLFPEPEPAPESEPEPQPAVIDPIDQCAADFRVLGSSDFRAKWMTRDTRPTYERACAEGRI